jgi:hypothetical protein
MWPYLPLGIQTAMVASVIYWCWREPHDYHIEPMHEYRVRPLVAVLVGSPASIVMWVISYMVFA